MHSAIVVVVMPEMPHDLPSNQKWQAFLASVDDLQRSKPHPLDKQKGVLRLTENVWQVNFHENPEAFSRLVYCCSQHKLTYGILQLDAVPQWLPDGFDPKTI